jgi:hypothetical protein
MPVTVSYVEIDNLDPVWPKVEAFVERALKHSDGELNTSQVRLLLTQRLAHLFVGLRGDEIVGCMVTEFRSFPNYRVANIIAVAGDEMWLDRTMFDKFRAWAKSRGCTKVETCCRPSVARLLEERCGMRQQYITMRAEA